MRFASLGSGSAGNALLVQSGQTLLMLDCGFGLRETTTRLSKLGVTPQQISALLITHEHDDHAGGAFQFAARHRIGVWITHGAWRASQRHRLESMEFPLHLIDSHNRLEIGNVELQPFPVPHDAAEPVQFIFHDGARKLGVLTDAGCATPHIREMLSLCHGLVLECNHDLDMLMNSAYPRSLKHRISSRQGHLDNASSAQLLSSLDNSRLQHIIAAHLSERNNTPALARQALCDALGCQDEWVQVATQATGFDWRQLA